MGLWVVVVFIAAAAVLPLLLLLLLLLLLFPRPPGGICGVWWLQLPLLLFPALLLLLVMLLQTLFLVLLRMMFAMLLHCVFQSYFDVALSVVFNAVSVQFHADLTVVPNAFRLYAYICSPMAFQCFLITRSHSR